eukprot:9383346-Alexandrium_andersonii.AAC.1
MCIRDRPTAPRGPLGCPRLPGSLPAARHTSGLVCRRSTRLCLGTRLCSNPLCLACRADFGLPPALL